MPIDFLFDDMLNQVISIESPTTTLGVNIPGAVKASWTPVVSNIPASIQPMSGDLVAEFGKLNIDVDYEIVSSSIYAGQVVNGYRVNDGTNKYIIHHWEDQGGAGLVWAIYAKLINI